jgi:hypothetical protein
MGPLVEGANALGHKLLILGDVNTGKTTLSRTILEAFCARGLGARIAIVDLAPFIPAGLGTHRGLAGVGGGLVPPADCNALHVTAHLEAPRLTSRSEAQAMDKASRNRALIEQLFQRADVAQRDILFVNDVTMYLQAGSAADLLAHCARAGTLIVNGYFGERLGGGELTLRERAQTQQLKAWFEHAGTVLLLDR